jgi:hypothetical protein
MTEPEAKSCADYVASLFTLLNEHQTAEIAKALQRYALDTRTVRHAIGLLFNESREFSMPALHALLRNAIGGMVLPPKLDRMDEAVRKREIARVDSTIASMSDAELARLKPLAVANCPPPLREHYAAKDVRNCTPLKQEIVALLTAGNGKPAEPREVNRA